MVDGGSRPEDERLLGLARAGDNAAYEQLYRDHLDGARHLARILVGSEHADELVAESFARVLSALRSGGGPTENFRSYLHVTIRNGYRDGLRTPAPAPVSDQPWLLDDAEPAAEEMVDGFDETVASDALSSLPESWQQVLWHVEVEGRKPAEVAKLMDMRPGAVSSLAHRAREGLKRAYLEQHAGPVPAREQCRWTHARMGQHARGDLGPRAAQRFDAHIESCGECRGAYLMVAQVNQKLAAYVLPAVLLIALPGAGKGLLWLGAAGGAVAGGTAGGAASGLPGSGGATSGGPVGVAVAAAAVVVAAVVGAVALGVVSGDDEEPKDVTAGSTAQSAPPEEDPPYSEQPTPDRPIPESTPEPPVSLVDVPGAPTDAPNDAPTEPSDAPSDDPLEGPTEDPTGDPTDDPSDPPTEEPDVPVVPVAPTETDIAACDTFGSVRPALTRGVTYTLVGNGKQGPWTVTAAATDGYVIKDGAPTRFTGDLGSYYACPQLVSVTTTDNPGPGHWRPDWDITTDVDVADGNPDQLLELIFRFNTFQVVPTDAIQGAGWVCPDVFGLKVRTLACTFDYVGISPPDLKVGVYDVPLLSDRAGSVTFKADGTESETEHFRG